MRRSTLGKDSAAETLSRAQAAAQGIVGFGSRAEANTIEPSVQHSKRLFGFTRKILPPGLPNMAVLFVYSVSDYGETVDVGSGLPKFTVEACPEGHTHGKACAIPCQVFLEEAKVDVTEFTPFTADQLADAIMKRGPGMPASLDRAKVGWFVSETNPPQQKEVDEAVKIYSEECQRLLRQGNQFAASNQLNEINETHRRAARFLRQKVDWDKATKKMAECPGCGELVREGVVWHATPAGCGHLFNPVKFWCQLVETGQRAIADVPEHLQPALAKELKGKAA
jgi:hypothetical protein